MDAHHSTSPRGTWLLLIALLVAAALLRLYHLQGPLLDRLYVKQVYVANLARQIAGPPWNPMRCQFDFLDEHGNQMKLYEEVPLYGALLGGATTFSENTSGSGGS